MKFFGIICRILERYGKEIPNLDVVRLEKYVVKISTLYEDCCYHNFAHAGHVLLNTARCIANFPSDKVELDNLEKFALLFTVR